MNPRARPHTKTSTINCIVPMINVTTDEQGFVCTSFDSSSVHI